MDGRRLQGGGAGVMAQRIWTVNKPRQSKVMLTATLLMLAATAFLIARNEELIFRDRGVVEVRFDKDDPETLIFTWRAQVEAPMARRFDEAWREWGDTGSRIVIDLHSPGGAVAEGEQVIRVIDRMKRTHIVDTRVRARRACYSMCVPIFLQGEERYAAPNSRFMFHEPTAYDLYTGEVVDEPEFERERASRRFFNRYFVNSPMDPVWRDRLAVEWKGRDVFYSGRELMEQGSNIITVLE